MPDLAIETLHCHGCSQLIPANAPVFERDETGLLGTVTRYYCSRDCWEEWDERDEGREYIE